MPAVINRMSSEPDSLSSDPFEILPLPVLSCEFCFASIADIPLGYEAYGASNPVWLEQDPIPGMGSLPSLEVMSRAMKEE